MTTRSEESVGSGSGRSLLPHHLAMLQSSAIAPDVIAERGYFSVEHKRDLEAIGFGRSQQIAPSLAIPIFGVVADEDPWFVHRPDRPRIKEGRARKYEIPAGRKMALDIHPRARPYLAKPDYPLFVVEGSKKADAMITAGARAVIGVVGVWNWRGRTDDNGLVLLADWEWVTLKEGRQVYVVYDSDIIIKQPVCLAMNRLGAALQRMGAHVAFTRLPSGDGGAKVGADDFLAAGGTLDDIVRLSTAAPPEPPSTSPGSCTPPNERATVQHPPPLAFERNILARLVNDLQAVGHAGEQRACMLLYLVIMSRLLDKIVSGVVKGPSAAGKSATVERVLEFFPAEAYYSLSGMSERALAYSEEPLKHRMFVVYEAAGLTGDWASYLMRSLLSENRVRYETVDKTSEGMKARVIEREGPTGLVVTTTAASLHAENETRLISIPVDDSPAQTKAVMLAIARQVSRTIDVSEWHTLQHWLADGGRRVTVPYAIQLAELIPPKAVRLRRDFGAVLGLIRAHALLHRATRDVDEHGRIVAASTDYAAVRALVNDLVTEGIGATVRPVTRETVAKVDELANANGHKHISVAELAAALEMDKSAVSRRARVALDAGYLRNEEDKRGRPYKLVIGDPLPEDIKILPSPEECCSVATGSGGIQEPPDVDDNESATGDIRTVADLTDEEILEILPGASIEEIDGDEAV